MFRISQPLGCALAIASIRGSPAFAESGLVAGVPLF